MKFYTCFSAPVITIAQKHGWSAGARYTNLRDCKKVGGPRFLDIDWKNYNASKHLEAAAETLPELTIARDVMDKNQLTEIIDEAYQLLQFSDNVAIVPKDERMAFDMEGQVPSDFIFAYSVPTRYGGTKIPPSFFKRPVHLLGGRPDNQRVLADQMRVVSMDCNRFAFDAKFGDFFDGETFRPCPAGGFYNCIEQSIVNINTLWEGYRQV